MKTIEEIKEEYAKEFGFTDGWKGYSFNYSIDPICDNQLDEITTRYAASQTEAMVKDILDIREKTLDTLRKALQGDGINLNELVVFIEEKTKHYEK